MNGLQVILCAKRKKARAPGHSFGVGKSICHIDQVLIERRAISELLTGVVTGEKLTVVRLLASRALITRSRAVMFILGASVNGGIENRREVFLISVMTRDAISLTELRLVMP